MKRIVSKTTQARVVSLGNFLLFGGIMLCIGWLAHQWINDWITSCNSIELGDLIAMGFGFFTEMMNDPGTPESIGLWSTAIMAGLSGFIQLRKLWQKRK